MKEFYFSIHTSTLFESSSKDKEQFLNKTRSMSRKKRQHFQERDDLFCPQTTWGAARALWGKRQIIDDKQKACKDELIFDVQ